MIAAAAAVAPPPSPPFVRLLEEKGGVIMGKTNTPEVRKEGREGREGGREGGREEGRVTVWEGREGGKEEWKEAKRRNTRTVTLPPSFPRFPPRASIAGCGCPDI